nr:hypothetical protein [Saprospiraceae bacterium]
MCGLTGIFHLDGRSIQEDVLDRMTDALAHRGPDGRGTCIRQSLGLGHRRLSILDVSSRGAQPMHSGDGRWTIVFNGCIYNFRELRKQLELLGSEFRSGTDTEVIAEGLRHFGPEYFLQFDGMFAIAAWDDREKALYISRDRFGVKPLYYYFDGRLFLFGSEIKAILAHPGYRMQLNAEALNEYFTFQNLFRYHTLFAGIHLLPAANTLRIDAHTKELRHRAWWDYNFAEADETMDFEDARREAERLLRQAVQRQMVSDV